MTVTTPPTLRQLVTRSDDHPALVVPESGASLSYAALQRALDRAAGRLAALGVREGDRVALVAANGPALVIAFLAVAARGAAAAPLNPALGVAEMAAELDDLRITRLLHDGSAAAATAAAETQVAASSMGMRDALLQVDDEAGEPIEDAGDPGALALLLHTSGTTSKPKTVPIRQRNLIASTGVIARGYGLHGDDVTMCVMPLFHVHGLVATVLATLSTGGTVVLPRFRPSTFWDDVASTARPGTPRSRPSTRGCSRGPSNCPRHQGTTSGSSAPARRRCPRSCGGATRTRSAPRSWRRTG